MKRKLTTLLLVFLIVIGVAIPAWADQTTAVDIRDRLGWTAETTILDAVTVQYFDASGNEIVAPNRPTVDASVKLTFNWSLLNPDGRPLTEQQQQLLQVGDYFEFTLPDQLVPHKDYHGIQMGSNGKIYATADISAVYDHQQVATSGKIRFTFTELAKQESNVQGDLTFWADFDQRDIDQPGNLELQFPVKEESTVDLSLAPTNNGSTIDKQVSVPGINPKTLAWTINVNKSYQDLTNASVRDVIPVDLTIDPDSVIVRMLDLDTSGNPTGERDVTDYQAVITSEQGQDVLTIHFGTQTQTTIHQAYVIHYTTNINQQQISDEGEQLTFQNDATLSADELTEPLHASAQATVTYGKLITKEQSGYDSMTQTYDWKIIYNGAAKQQAAGKVITDTYDARLTFLPETLMIVDEDQQVIYDGQTPQQYAQVHITQDTDQSTFIIQFLQAVNKIYTITYKTKLKDGIYVTGATGLSGITNTAETDQQVAQVNGGSAVQQMVVKYGYTDYQLGQMNWTVEINRNHYEIQNYVMVDQFESKGLSYVAGSLSVVRNTVDGQWITADASDYEITDVFENGFNVHFINGLATTTDRLIVRYATTYDPTQREVVSWLNNDYDKAYAFVNRAIVTWTDINQTVHTDETAAKAWMNQETALNAKKDGSYNATDKEITWNIALNYRNETNTNVSVLRDPLTQGQQYVEDSLTIRTYSVDTSGAIVLGDVLPQTEWTTLGIAVTEPDAKGENTLIVRLPAQQQTRYYVSFRTSLANQEIYQTYTNVAQFTHNGQSSELHASVTAVHGNQFISKSGLQNGSKVEWKVEINRSQSKIEDPVLTDTPSTNQLILKDTIRIYPVTTAADGNYTEDWEHPLNTDLYDITYQEENGVIQTFSIQFLTSIEQTYVLRYASQIIATGENETITNDASLQGMKVIKDTEESSAPVTIDIRLAYGYAQGELQDVHLGTLRIRKIDETTDLPLSGVTFVLMTQDRTELSQQTTDEAGEIVWSNLPYGTYYLKEVNPLAQYTVAQSLIDGTYAISVDAKGSEAGVFTTIGNHKNRVVIEKQDAQGHLLDGSVYQLYRLSDGQQALVRDDLAITGGRLVLEGLSPGVYSLEEKSAPTGYLLNLAKTTFEVLRDASGVPLDLEDPVVLTDYQGVLTLHKQTTTGDPLAGVTYALYDQDQQVVSRGTTDASGTLQMTQLAPGDYVLQELSSADGYVADTTPISVTIVAAFNGEPEPVVLTLSNNKAQITLSKKGVDQKPLSGAVYALIDADGTIVSELTSDEQGQVLFTNVAPGDYTVLELIAPEGYIRNTTPLAVTVTKAFAGSIQTIDLGDQINEQGQILISKTDTQGEGLAGAVFVLTDEDGNEVSARSDKDGSVRFMNLAPGQYTLVETKAPAGYRLTTETMSVTIAAEAQGTPKAVRVTFVNELISPLPETGLRVQAPHLFYAVMFGGGILLLLGIWLEVRLNRIH